MALLKCCVGGCDATSATHRLYCLPKNDSLRSLWMKFLVPTNSLLLGLSKDQLINRRVCQKHFDKHNFDQEGRRHRYSYPSLITPEEIARGEPLPALGEAVTEHNYCKIEDDKDDVDETMLVIGRASMNEHNYCSEIFTGHPSCSHTPATSVLDKNIMESKHDVHVLKIQDHTDPCTGPHGAAAIAAPSPLLQCTRTVKKSSHKNRGSKQQQQLIKKAKHIMNDSFRLTNSKRLAQAQIFANNKLFENFQHLSQQAQTFLIMQLRECRKNKMARRFTMEEKLMALLLMKQSPKEYKLLQNMFALPNKRTLHRMSEKISVEPGLNPQIFSYIKNKTKNWEAKEKLCTIVFDEVALTPHLTYQEKLDQILGFVDMAGERQLKLCDHALVFMLRGICSPWRQSIAYYFCEGTVSAPALQNILKQMVTQVAQAGLTPLGLVCDQGSTFRTAIKNLKEETLRLRTIQRLHDDGSVNIAGHDLSIFFDPPHLLKGIRNNFLNKNIICEGKKASWKDIQFIYDLDSQLGHTRALPKLTEHHINAEKIKKMKVSVATQVLSARTAAMLKYTNALNMHHTGNPGTMETTAEVVEFLDKLFDSVNGSPGGTKRGKLRKAVKKNSEHVAFWTESIRKFKTIKFEDCESKVAKQSGKPRLVRVPSLEGWITTLESFIRLTKLLFEKYSVDYYYPRNINQDPLENFFGRIRALNYRNTNPDANTFIYAFKSLLITNILSPHSKFANCEVDNGETLIDVGFLFEEKTNDKENNSPNISSPLSCSQEHLQSSGSLSRQKVLLEKVKVQCSAYTAGYICRKLTKYIKCKSCLNTYTSSSVEGIHTYIKHREYKNLKNDNLVYPTEKVIREYRDISQYVHDYLDKNCFKTLIFKNISNTLSSIQRFSWLGCAKHKSLMKSLFIKYVVKLQVHNWCNKVNKILKGGINKKHVSEMQQMQKLALIKHEKYFLRKKALKK